jgi:1,4-dihydroxy-2-naphthoate octaprenyltransferase
VWWRAGLALIVSVLLQVGVNYANDYSDGIRGTDEVRVGPARLVGGGLASPGAVKRAALISFGGAAVAGAVLAFSTTPWLFLVGAVSILAGWFYTGGAHPYGYLGLGEVFVFVFFGLVATVGTVFVVVERVPWTAWAMGSAVGALACALLVTNNLRDIPTDSTVGKRTLAVRLGDRRTRFMYGALVVGALAIPVTVAFERIAVLIVLISAPLAVSSIRRVRSGAEGRDLIPVLGLTSRLQTVFGLLAVVGLLITRR